MALYEITEEISLNWNCVGNENQAHVFWMKPKRESEVKIVVPEKEKKQHVRFPGENN